MTSSMSVFCSKKPEHVWRVVRTFHEALLAAESLLSDGLVEKIWVTGGVSVYQVIIYSSGWSLSAGLAVRYRQTVECCQITSVKTYN